MGLFRQFLAVEAAALLTLLMVAGGVAMYGAIDSSMHSNSLLDPASSAQIGFGYTAVGGGLVPVVLLGAPACFICSKKVFHAGITPFFQESYLAVSHSL